MATLDKNDKGIKFTLAKVPNPEEGVSREQYEAICRALGVTPKPSKQEERTDEPA